MDLLQSSNVFKNVKPIPDNKLFRYDLQQFIARMMSKDPI